MPATRGYKEGYEVPILHGAVWSRGRQEGEGFNELYIRRTEDYL